MFVHYATHVGREREHNEDTARVLRMHRVVGDPTSTDEGTDTEGYLLVVCDGMGGHAAGDIASQEACLAIIESLGDAVAEGTVHLDPPAAIVQALTDANQQVLSEAARLQKRGMGTTAVVCLVLGDRAWVGWVGDSRLYAYRQGRLHKKTEDHSRVQQMLKHGILTPEEAVDHPESHVLTMAIGGGSGAQSNFHPEVWTDPLVLTDGDVLMLSTDGLHDLLDDQDLAEIMGGQPVDRACALLVDEANQAGGHDNITVALLSVSPLIPPPGPRPRAQPAQAPPVVVEATVEPEVATRPPASTAPQASAPSRPKAPSWAWAGLGLGLLLTGGAAAWFGLGLSGASPPTDPVTDGPFAGKTATPCPPDDQWPADMVCIEGGVFERQAITSTCDLDGDAVYAATEPVWVDTFFVDVGEVTNQDWDRCASACACDAKVDDGPEFLGAQQPRISVSWEDAQAYCALQGKRLLSETEWDRALWGTGNDEAPLRPGDATCETATFGGCTTGGSTTRDKGTTDLRGGTWDMVGNAPEWVADWYTPDLSLCDGCDGENPSGPSTGTERVLKGGTYTKGPECAFGQQRRGYDPANPTHSNLGFRCGVSLDQAPGVTDQFSASFDPDNPNPNSWAAKDDHFRQKTLDPDSAFTTYKDPEMAEQLLRSYHQAYPKVTRLHQLEGRTHQGRSLWAIQITDFSIDDREKARVFFNGAHHGHELMSVEYAFDVIDQVLRRHTSGDEQALAWLEQLDLWVVPMVNPDGVWLTLYLHDGDGGEKLGGRKNGLDYPSVCDPSDQRLGVDLNRNYPYGFGEKGSDGRASQWNYRGPSAGSEPETQAVMALAHDKHFVAALTFHTKYPAVITPYTVGDRTNPNPDVARHVAREIAPKNFPVLDNLYPVAGTDQDWLFHTFGTLAFIIEGEVHNPLPLERRRQSRETVRTATERLLDHLVAGPRVWGWVEDKNGKPVEATVRLKQFETHEGENWTSRPDGRFDRYVVLPGTYDLIVEANGQTVSVQVNTDEMPVIVQLP